jgi:hypothetical protein
MSYTVRVFISSKQSEFEAERAVLANELRHIPLFEPILAEEWNPTGTNVHEVYLRDVRTCPIYVGLFGSIYSEPTHLEYLAACDNPYREKLIYLKKSENIQDKLQDLIKDFNHLHVPAKFNTIGDLVPVFSKHLMAALSRMISVLQLMGEKMPVTYGLGGAMQRRWVSRQKQVIELGLPVPATTNQHNEFIAEIESAMTSLETMV